MTSTHNEMMKIVLDSKALSIWNRETGPVFWGAAKVPMPFYINTELMIGQSLAADMLKKIDETVGKTKDPTERAKLLDAFIMPAYEQTPVWKKIIDALIARSRTDFPAGSTTAISGGERRDWLFSIPFAKAIGIRHAYLFKDKSIYCMPALKSGEQVLHVCDLVNNAASHFDAWIPMLEQAGAKCMGTACVNSRGSAGVSRLEKAGYKVSALNSIDVDFFNQCLATGLIDQATRDEIALFFSSNKDWAAKYILHSIDLFHIKTMDAKSIDRMKGFFTQDPWGLRNGHEAFFMEVGKALSTKVA
jgi:hypothetical protein